MNKNKFKRVLSIALATVMVAGTIAFTPQGASEVQAAPTATVKNINLGTGGLANTGSKVYFGLDTSSTISKVNSDNTIAATSDYTKSTANNLWRVLDASNGLLFADDIIAERRYDDNSNDWNSSELKSWLNGDTYKTNSDKFTTIEQGAIAENTDGDMRLLTIEEVEKTEYGFTDNAARAASSWWLLRSPGFYDNFAAIVYDDGRVGSIACNVDSGRGSVRPAFNLNLSSVLFSSASSASKSSFAKVGEDQVSANIWKLTLKDSSKTVSVTNGESVTQSGQNVTVPYTYTGNDVSQISIMITDKAYTESDASILYYGALNTTLAATGTGTFTLPSGLPDGYKIYMMAEDVNGDTLTDYSSTPVEIIPVKTIDVTITNPADSHITLSTEAGNGTETQSVLTGAMTSVVYTADDGYYFTEGYTVAGSNGITVTRDSYTQITVSGTPTADASITLVAATEKESQEAPSVTDGVDKISGTTTAMEYASSESASTWTPCSDGNTTVAAGTWYVRYAATDTKKAGTVASVEVTTTPDEPTPSTPTYTITAGAGGTHELNTDGTLTITCDGALDKLTGIYVDDKLVDEANYTLVSGSTILTFKAEYLNTLSVGTHTVKFQYTDGSAETTFVIKAADTDAEQDENTAPEATVTTPDDTNTNTTTEETTTTTEAAPKTGDNTPIVVLLIIAVISVAGVIYLGRKKKTVR